MSPSGPLHDATFIDLRADWAAGDVALRFRTATAELTIRGVRATRLDWTRRLPWGESVSVNEVTGPTALPKGSGWRFEVEMQTGDTLILEAAEITEERAPLS